MVYHLPERNLFYPNPKGTVLVPALANGEVYEPEPTPAPQEVRCLGAACPGGRTLTYRKSSTMLVTIPVTISTIPSTQKRPVHEVKST